MQFAWLKDALIRVLFENEEIIAVDKPYGFDTHTNESKAGHAEFVQPGLIELFEKQRGSPLHIVHRLDRTTSGVIVFAKTLEAAKRYQGFFRARETKKTYLFVTASRSQMRSTSCHQPILRNGDELEASTDFLKLNEAEGFELWQAHPKTGRNHQIRIHAASVGLPLLGDGKYGGRTFPFICLHNAKIEFPDGIVIESRTPRFFADLSLLKDPELSRDLLEIEKRERLFQVSTRLADEFSDQAFRLIHSDKRGTGRTASLDRFGSRLVLSWYEETWTENERRRYVKLGELLRSPILVRFMTLKRAPEWLSGPPVERWTAREMQICHELRVQGLGLYLDQRLQRRWVYENSRGKSVLNLFASTGGFSVAAALGGATDVVSVDANKNMLNWARENFALNGLEAGASTFLCRDPLSYLEQISGKKKFDLVICDPPSFSRGEKGVFKIEQELEKLLGFLLNVGRVILFSTNADSLYVDDIRKMILVADPSADITSLQPSLDFEAPGERVRLKSFLISTK